MLRTLSAVTFISLLPFMAFGHQGGEPCLAELTIPAGQSFKPTAIAQTRMPEKNGWSIQWHKNAKGDYELLAVNQAALIVRRIQPMTGQILSEVKYLGGARHTGPSVIHSAKNGELIVARAVEDTVEVFNERGGQPVIAISKESVKSLQIVSLKNGEVFAVAAGNSSVQIFKRDGARLEQVAIVTSEAPIRQVFAAAGNSGDIEIALFNLDHKVKAYNYDADVEALEPGSAVVQLGGKLSATSVDGRLMLFSSENRREGATIRVFSMDDRSVSRTLDLQPLAGELMWGDKAANMVVPLQLPDKLVLRRIDIATGKAIGEDLAIGDGRIVSDLSQFRIGNKVFYVFSKDGSLAYIQNENEVSVIAAPERSLIRQITPAVMLANGTPVLGVLGYGPSGSVVNIISLTGSKILPVKLQSTATAE